MMLGDIIKDRIPGGTFWTHRLHLVSGCTEVSPGCLNCWMRTEARLREKHPHPDVRALHKGLLTGDGKRWNGAVRFNGHLLAKAIPKTSRGKRKAWAVWSDLFHEGLFKEHVRATLDTVRRSPDFFIIVTKRAERAYYDLREVAHLSNVIILVTMEDQERVNLRAPWAMRMAAEGWNVGILAEPLLGRIDLSEWLGIWWNQARGQFVRDSMEFPFPFRWLITGGESGHRARLCRMDWVRSLRDQAVAAGVPFLFKQWGGYRGPEDWDTPPGRILDGRTWDEVADI